jgi:hypothetical protein
MGVLSTSFSSGKRYVSSSPPAPFLFTDACGSQVCDFIAQHRERFAPFLDEDEGLEAHLESMRLQGPSLLPLAPSRSSTTRADGDCGCRDMGHVY